MLLEAIAKMPFPQRLPIVNGDDGQWGDILDQYLKKEHYDDGTDNAANGGHKTVTIRAGTATAGTAPLKFTSGTLLSTPEAGAMEFLSDALYFTVTTGTTRKKIALYDDSSGATGDIYYRDASGNIVRLAIGSAGDVLKVSSGLPSWSAPTTSTPGGSSGQVQFNSSSTFGGAAGLTYQSGASPNVTVTAQNSAYTPLEVRGAASQSVNLQEWKTSTPTLLTAVDSAGKVVFGSTGDTNLYRSAANTLATDDDVNIKGGKALKIDGATSGTVSINTAATTGTWTFTVPSGTGSAGQFLKTDGAGVGSWSYITYSTATKTANYTIATSDTVILGDATSGAITITLPAASTVSGYRFYVKKIDSSANTVTIARTGADTIDGGTSAVISVQYVTLNLVSNGTNWFII